MKTKNSVLMFAGVFALLFVAGFASAALQFTPDSFTVTINQGASSTLNFNVENDISTSFDSTSHAVSGFVSGTSSIPSGSFVLSGLSSSIAGSSNEDVSLQVNIPSSQAPGTYTGTLTVSGDYGASSFDYDLPITITVPAPAPDWQDDFCIWDSSDEVRTMSNPGDLRTKIEDITVTGLGDDREWLPFDEIEVTVNVDNRGSDKVDAIEVEWGLYDTSSDQWVIDVDNEKDFDLRDGKDDSVIFTFNIDDKMDVDLQDLDDGDHYILYVRATGEMAEGDNEGQDTCDADTNDISLVIERDFVILNSFDYPDTVQCNADFHVSADTWNIGSRDQDEVTVHVTNSELGINQVVDVGDINSFEQEAFDFTTKMPKDAEEKTYFLTLEVLDDSDDIYVNDYNDDESRYSVPVAVSGGCSSSPAGDKSVLVSANLESGGEAGKPLVVKAKVTNSGSERAVFSINAAGFAQWASSGVAQPETLDLNPGQSGDVVFTFDVNSDASGENLFDIEVVSNNELVASQPVSVSVTPKSSGLSSIFGDNYLIWVFVIVDVILVAIIVIVAMKVVRK